jgi:hypothetical protein
MTEKTDNMELRELERILDVQKKYDPTLEDNIENVLDWKTPMSFFRKAIAQARQEERENILIELLNDPHALEDELIDLEKGETR